MKLIKQFTADVTIYESSNLYINKLQIALEDIKTRFEKKCYKSAYIDSIIEIIDCSAVVIMNNDNNCIGKMSVLFSANIIQIEAGDVIVDLQADKFRNSSDNRRLICKNDYCIADIVADSNISSFIKEGMYVPIYVDEVKYNSLKSHIIVMGSIITPTLMRRKYTNACYKLNSSLTPEEKINLSSLFTAEYKKQYNLVNDNNNKKAMVYRTMMYPFQEERRPTITGKDVPLADLKFAESDIICRPKEQPLYKQTIRLTDVKHPIVLASYDALLYFIIEHIKHIEALFYMCENYPPISPTDKHNFHFWKKYRESF